MNDSKVLNRNNAFIAIAALGALFALSIVYFKERLLFADTPFVMFDIINYGKIYVLNERFGSFITQLVPYLCLKLHLSNYAVLFSYSISFNLFFLVAGLFLAFRYQQYLLAIIMAFYYLLLVSDSFFLANDEVHQAVAWMFLFFGATMSIGEKHGSLLRVLPAFIVFGFLTIFTHFVVLIPMIYLWVYFILEKEHWPYSKKETFILSLIILVLVAAKYIRSQSNPYEEDHLHGATHFSIKDLLQALTHAEIARFCHRCLTQYWIAIVIYVLGLRSLIRLNKRKLLGWTLLSTFGYLMLIGLTYTSDTLAPMFHIETEWQSLGIIIATPFVFSFLPTIKPKFGASLLIVIFCVRLFYVNASAPAFTWRVNFEQQVLDQMKRKGISKLALITDTSMNSKLELVWSIPYETLILSALNGDKPQSTFYITDPESKKLQDEALTSRGFYNVWNMLPPSQINLRRFNIDTTTTYSSLRYDELMK